MAASERALKGRGKGGAQWDDESFKFETGPTPEAMLRQMRGVEGHIEKNSQWGQEFTENRGKTVWEDGLIAHGLKEAPPPTDCEKADEAILEAYLDKQELEKKKSAKEKSESDLSDSDEEFFKSYRNHRIQEMKGAAEDGGKALETIVAPDFEEKVVIKSLKSPVVMLIFSGSQECDALSALLLPLSFKFKNVTFLRIEANSMLRNVPKEDCPIVMVYRKGKVIGQFTKLKSFHGSKTTSDVIEWDLSRLGIIETELEEDPRPKFSITSSGKGSSRNNNNDDDDF